MSSEVVTKKCKDTKKKTSINQNKRKIERQSYLMLAPQIIGFLVFSIYPILWVFRYSFYDYDGVNATFIGFDNFVRVFTRDPAYWKSILNTIIISYGKLIIELPLALITALVLGNKAIKIKKVFSLGFYLPRITGTAVNCLIFAFLFATFNGPVNNALTEFGIISEAVNWFGSKWTAMLVIIIESMWSGFAANVLYFMAGVSNIPDDVMEAAKVDGAGRFATFFKITLPMLAPIIRIVLMLAMVDGMKIMNEVLLLTNGGPGDGTNVVMLQIYKMFFVSGESPQYGYASALGVVTTFVIGILTFIYLKVSKKAEQVG